MSAMEHVKEVLGMEELVMAEPAMEEIWMALKSSSRGGSGS